MIYVFLAQGFEEIEALATVDILRRADFEVITVGIGGKTITGAHGVTVLADETDSSVKIDQSFEAMVLPGGMPGTLNLEKSSLVMNTLRYAADNNKLICAICAAPSILGHAGLLKGKKAICFPGFEDELEGVVLVDDYVTQDGNIITAKGAGVAADFAFKITEALKDKNLSDKIRMSMQCIL